MAQGELESILGRLPAAEGLYVEARNILGGLSSARGQKL